MPATAAAAAAAWALMISRRVSSMAQPPSSLVPAVRSGGRPARPTARRRARGSLASRSTMPPELSVSSVTTILPVSLAPWTSTPSSAARAARTAGQRCRPGMDEQARDVQLSRHGRGAAAGDLDGGDRAEGDALAAAGAGGEVDLGRRHAAEHWGGSGSHPRDRRRGSSGRRRRAGRGSRRATRACGPRARRAAAAAEQGASRERGCAAGHARHSAGAPGGPATSWYIQIRKP